MFYHIQASTKHFAHLTFTLEPQTINIIFRSFIFVIFWIGIGLILNFFSHK